MACLYYKVKQGQEKVLSHEIVLFVTVSLRDVMKIINMKILHNNVNEVPSYKQKSTAQTILYSSFLWFELFI